MISVFRRFAGVQVALVVLLSVVLSLLGGAAADAGTVDQRTGRPGEVTFGPQMVLGAVCLYMGPSQPCIDSPYVTNSPTDVKRSAGASGAQIVTVDYVAYHWEGSWVARKQVRTRGDIGAAQSTVRMPVPTISVLDGYTTVAATFSWWTATGQLIGSVRYTWDRSGEYLCRVQTLNCSTGPGWVWVGYRY